MHIIFELGLRKIAGSLVSLVKNNSLTNSSHFKVSLDSPMEYWIDDCMPSNKMIDLPTQPPDNGDKTWMFTKTSTAFIISCNGVEVLNYVFSDSSKSNCQKIWSLDVEDITISNYDEVASYYYFSPISKSGNQCS